MKEKLIQEVLSTGNQLSRKKLEELTTESLQMIVTLRGRYVN